MDLRARLLQGADGALQPRQGYRIWHWKNFPVVVWPLGPGSSLATLARPGHEILVSRASVASALARAERDTDLGLARDRQLNARKSGKPDLRGPSAKSAKHIVQSSQRRVGSNAIALPGQAARYGTARSIEKKRPRRSGALTFQSYRGAGSGGGTTTAGPPTVPLLSQTLVVLIAPSASVRDV
jgi:hypothetical protein